MSPERILEITINELAHKEKTMMEVVAHIRGANRLKESWIAMHDALQMINVCGVSVLDGHRARAEQALALADKILNTDNVQVKQSKGEG